MIVITTMDTLPDYCYECPCNNGENGRCEADKEKRSTFEYRPFWCPLKEVSSLAILKEQEAVPDIFDGCVKQWFTCGKCGETIRDHDKYCSQCGTKVKWG